MCDSRAAFWRKVTNHLNSLTPGVSTVCIPKLPSRVSDFLSAMNWPSGRHILGCCDGRRWLELPDIPANLSVSQAALIAVSLVMPAAMIAGCVIRGVLTLRQCPRGGHVNIPAHPPPPQRRHTTQLTRYLLPAGGVPAGLRLRRVDLCLPPPSLPPLPSCRAATPRRTGHLGCQMVTPAAPSGAAVESPPRPNGQIPAERVEGAGRSPVEPRRPGSVGKNVIKT